MPRPGYEQRREFSLICQKIALEKVYPYLFPPSKYRLFEVDDMAGDLAKTLDIGGIDKIFTAIGSGHLISLGNRYREAAVWNNQNWRDFTIREREWDRHVEAIKNNGTLPDFYGYGYANTSRVNPKNITDFLKFYVINYKQWFSDVQQHLTQGPFFKETNGKQENFYWIKWSQIPEKYFTLTYPIEALESISPTEVDAIPVPKQPEMVQLNMFDS